MHNQRFLLICKFACIALVLAFIALFIHESRYYPLTPDDAFFLSIVKLKGVFKGALYFYTDCNGRWFSHLFTCTVFGMLKDQIQYYWIYLLLMILWFSCALSYLLKVLVQRYYSTALSWPFSLLTGLTVTAGLYFFMFEGRFEVWYWMSSVSMHLLSLTFLFTGFAIVLSPRRNSAVRSVVMLFSFMAAGGLNEFYAITAGLLLLLLCLFSPVPGAPGRKEQLIRIAFALGVLLISFSINLFSSGIKTRLGILPSFTLGQSLRNTVHTALFPLLHYQLIPLKLLTLLVLCGACLLIGNKAGAMHIKKKGWEFYAGGAAVVSLLLFMNCYVLSDTAPFRSQSMAYLIVVLLLMDFLLRYFIKKSPVRGF